MGNRTRIRWVNVARLGAAAIGCVALVVGLPALLERPKPPPLPDDIGLAHAAGPRPAPPPRTTWPPRPPGPPPPPRRRARPRRRRRPPTPPRRPVRQSQGTRPTASDTTRPGPTVTTRPPRPIATTLRRPQPRSP